MGFHYDPTRRWQRYLFIPFSRQATSEAPLRMPQDGQLCARAAGLSHDEENEDGYNLEATIFTPKNYSVLQVNPQLDFPREAQPSDMNSP